MKDTKAYAKKIDEKYPEELTFDEFDDNPGDWKIWLQFADEKLDDSTVVIKNDRDRVEAVELIAQELGGVVYYQVDLESGERGYSRTPDTWIGIYEIVK